MAEEKKRWTPAQQAAIDQRDRTLLVSAAAGSGKTATLTERVIRMLTDPSAPADISRMLIVTFTNAAAGELRERISGAISAALRDDPSNTRLARQLLLLPDADICTIDGFCRKLLREHAAEAGLRADFRISDETETSLLLRSVMEQLVNRAFAGEEEGIASGDEFSSFADHLVSARNEASLADILISLYERTDGFPEGAEVFFTYAEKLMASSELPPEKNPWGELLLRHTSDFGRHAALCLRSVLSAQEKGGKVALRCAEAADAEIAFYEQLSEATGQSYAAVREALERVPAPRFPSFRAEEEKLEALPFREVRDAMRKEREKLSRLFLYTAEEWKPLLVTLGETVSLIARLLRRFHEILTEEKRRRNIASFGDLEHLALSLLCDKSTPTPLARELRETYDAIFVDEYQDINSVQHAIFSSIATERNRFMVGDIKQSIYGFRLAEPEIFASMRASFPPLATAGDSPCATVFMSENFRCDSTVIDFVNAIFDRLLGVAGESIGYREDDRLSFAKQKKDGVFPIKATVAIFKSRKEAENEAVAEGEPPAEDEEAEAAETRYVAAEIARLLREERLADGEPFRPGDIAILLRSAKGRAAVYRDALLALGIPAVSEEKDNFFLNPEIRLALSILGAIDNPRRDIPLAGALVSPIFRFSPDDVLEIRRFSERSIPLYDALVAYTDAHPDFEKGRTFLSSLLRLRERAEGMPADELMRLIFAETGLLSIGGASGAGGRRNLLLLYHFARTYSSSSFKGLYQFINYLNEILREKKSFRSPDAAGAGGDAVRIMTIHGSKGLEFPVCFLADAGRSIRPRNGKDSLMFDPALGLALKLRDSTGFARLDNPVLRAIGQVTEDKSAEEDLRLLYVALTRARERLYVTGTVGGNTAFEKFLAKCRIGRIALDGYTVRSACSYMEWILLALGEDPDVATLLLHPESDTVPEEGVLSEFGEDAPREADPNDLRVLRERFAYRYRYPHLGRLPGKLSVSSLSPVVLDGSSDRATVRIPPPEKGDPTAPRLPLFYGGEDPSIGARRGTATHEFLQFCDLRALFDGGVEAEAERMERERFLSRDTLSLIRRDELEVFCRSPLLREMLEARRVHRELRFNVMLPASLFTSDAALTAELGEESVLVQGVMDCVTEGKDGALTLIDYKTDRIPKRLKSEADAAAFLTERYTEQLTYYALALRRMFGKEPERILLYSLALGRSIPVSVSLPDAHLFG